MRDLDYQDQAERFLGWFFKLSLGTSLEGAFREWSGSKDFHPEARKVIWDLVQKEF
ncbi:MAG: hypothetical protein V3U14_00140 [candidate division NC10 bacterium]|jgi:hypothetical protein